MKSLAVVFPGQGSQFVGMLADVAETYPQIKSTFEIASNVLSYDLWTLVQEGPAEKLDKTIHTQPALLTASYALWQILNLKPVCLAGHSLGEYTALVCANAISFEDAVRLVAARGLFMQEAIPAGEGALAAIVGLDDGIVKDICEKAASVGEVLAPANYNSPGQVVVAGHTTAVERSLILAKAAGAKLAKILPVSVPSHCILMKSASEKLRDCLKNIPINIPTIPIFSNVDASPYTHPDAIREGLAKQLFMPVRWVETIQNMFHQYNISDMVECGPGKVLSGLNKRILPDIQLIPLQTLLS